MCWIISLQKKFVYRYQVFFMASLHETSNIHIVESHMKKLILCNFSTIGEHYHTIIITQTHHQQVLNSCFFGIKNGAEIIDSNPNLSWIPSPPKPLHWYFSQVKYYPPTFWLQSQEHRENAQLWLQNSHSMDINPTQSLHNNGYSVSNLKI
jgi:hypothetical protein